MLRTVETVIIDEIHALVRDQARRAPVPVAGAAGGAARQSERRPLQRIGLSATQRPLEEIARLLGGGRGCDAGDGTLAAARPVEIIDAGAAEDASSCTIEVPVEDMAQLGRVEEIPSRPSRRRAPVRASIWPSIHPRLVELIRAHRSTMIFVNSRRLAERLAAALNELAGEEIALAHHGSIAREARLEIEDRLKRGQLPAIVATSSLELGIDMGAVDLVIQIEAPPSVASGMQRIGRAGPLGRRRHRAASSSPSTAAICWPAPRPTARMRDGEVEETVLPAQPARRARPADRRDASAMDPIGVDELYRPGARRRAVCRAAARAVRGRARHALGPLPVGRVRRAAAAHHLGPRRRHAAPREGAQRLAVLNGGTIPDRGLYGVFLAGDGRRTTSRASASSTKRWCSRRAPATSSCSAPPRGASRRSPRPGAGDARARRAGQDAVLARRRARPAARVRPRDRRAVARSCARRPPKARRSGCTRSTRSTRSAAAQPAAVRRTTRPRRPARCRATGPSSSSASSTSSATGASASSRRSARACTRPGRSRSRRGCAATTAGEVDMMWSDDGIVFRLPEARRAAAIGRCSCRLRTRSRTRSSRQLGQTALFAARFRENAARALLLPRRQPGQRTPLWAQRKRPPICWRSRRATAVPDHARDVPRVPARRVRRAGARSSCCGEIEQPRRFASMTVDRAAPSPFAASLLFNYSANFIYDGDAPLAERRAQALSSITPSCASCSARPSCASCSTPTRSTTLER